jgi:hypothetical protein
VVNVFKSLDKYAVLSWIFAILIGVGFAALLTKILPANIPRLWIKWAALPVIYVAQRFILSEMKNPVKFDNQEDR